MRAAHACTARISFVRAMRPAQTAPTVRRASASAVTVKESSMNASVPMIAGPACHRAAALAPAADRIGRLADAWQRWRRVRAGIADLRALDARSLADLGLDRGTIEHAVRSGRID
jgi:uncharacterized protein YjiS (DUF1127 family)